MSNRRWMAGGNLVDVLTAGPPWDLTAVVSISLSGDLDFVGNFQHFFSV